MSTENKLDKFTYNLMLDLDLFNVTSHGIEMPTNQNLLIIGIEYTFWW